MVCDVLGLLNTHRVSRCALRWAGLAGKPPAWNGVLPGGNRVKVPRAGEKTPPVSSEKDNTRETSLATLWYAFHTAPQGLAPGSSAPKGVKWFPAESEREAPPRLKMDPERA